MVCCNIKAALKATWIFVILIKFVQNEPVCSRSSEGKRILDETSGYWSNELEGTLTKSFDQASNSFLVDLSGKKLRETQKGCGRMQNRVGILSDGSKICIRYRQNLEQIQGELFSFHFGKLLGLRNILEPNLLLINKSNEFWSHIDIRKNSWEELNIVVSTKFIDETYPVYIPEILMKEDFTMNRNTSFCGSNCRNLLHLLQWSDMILFDFLIGNFDRVVSNLFNLQWYSRSLIEPIENLLQLNSGLFVLIDNEDGFSHGYRLLEKYDPYHLKLLKKLCIFRKETVNRLKHLNNLTASELWDLLWRSLKRTNGNSSVLDYIPKMSERNRAVLKHRIHLVNGYISNCDVQ